VIVGLLRLAAASEAIESPAAIKEGRKTLLQALRLTEIYFSGLADEHKLRG
jgi:hypothetical protein